MTTLPPNETFAHPTVTQVIFQIRFPRLFFLPTKIGELQLSLMSKFPTSESFIQRSVVMVNGPGESIQELLKDRGDEEDQRVWKFSNDAGIAVEVQLNSVTLVSSRHTSYRNEPGAFRDAIDWVLKAFLQHAPITMISRVGLRYTDACPFPQPTTEAFGRYFNSVLPVARFSVESCSALQSRAVTRRDGLLLQYTEQIATRERDGTKQHVLVLDMDAFGENIKSSDVLATTDRLHDIIRREFEATIKEPVLVYMRTGELS